MYEDKTNPFESLPVQCKSDGDWLVHCDHAAKGMNFSFDDRQKWMWQWTLMVAQLRDEDQKEIVEGPDGRSRGLLSCWCAPRPNSYDHQRHVQLKESGTPSETKLPFWDFVLIRDGGGGVRLHPSYDKTAVAAFEVEGFAEPVEAPRQLGGTWGPGTYYHFKTIGLQKMYKFDHRNNPGMTPWP